jgi:hypothetical protein
MKHMMMGLLIAGLFAGCGSDASEEEAPRPDVSPAKPTPSIPMKPTQPSVEDDDDDPDDEEPASGAGRLDAQLLWKEGQDLGSGTALFYRRFRMYSNGSFEECDWYYAVSTGGFGGTQTNRKPERNSGSYEITGSSLSLSYVNGERKELSFVYAPGQSTVSIGGRPYVAEKPGSTALCDFD